MAESWNELLAFLAESNWVGPLLPVATLAAKDEILKHLYPYTSHSALGFSETKTYPHTRGLPFIIPKDDGSFEVTTGIHEVLGRGTAEQAVAMVKAIYSYIETGESKDHPLIGLHTHTSLVPGSIATKYLVVWANLENEIRLAFKLKDVEVPKKYIFKALEKQKPARLEALLKLRNNIVHGDGKAVGRITPEVLREVLHLHPAAHCADATVRIPRKKTARSPRGRTKSAVKTP